MNRLSEGVTAVRQAEREVRRLMTDAVDQGDYDAVIPLTALARGLASVLANLGGEAASSQANAGARAPKKPPSAPPRAAPGTSPRARSARKASQRKQHPRFVRDGDALVKFGWSKKAKREYEHRAPKRILLALADALQASGDGGTRFSMEDVLPIHDAEAGGDAPTYQVYVCLAWLRQVGLVKQHGRQGYSLDAAVHLPSAVRNNWTGIPDKGATS